MKTNRKKIVAFGCSHTYGHNLCDYSTFEHSAPDAPSEFAWPNQLCKLLYDESYSLNNLAIAGSSLELQLRRARTVNLRQYNAAIILLPEPSRNVLSRSTATSCEDTIFWNNYDQFLPSYVPDIPKKLHRLFYKLHSNSELQYRWASSIDHLRALLHLCNVPYAIAFRNNTDIHSYHTFTNSKVFEPLPDRPLFYDHDIDRARDGSHLGIKSNLKFAQAMYDNINTVGWTTK